MAIYNVTPNTFDHICSADMPDGTPLCRISRAGLPHSEVQRISHPLGDALDIICPDGHTESLNLNLLEWEETSPTRDESSREQVRNVRQLQRHITGNAP